MPFAPQPLISPNQLAHQLLAARKARKLSQGELASRLGLSQSRVSHLEQHAQDLSVAQLMAWCASLGLELAICQRDTLTEASASSIW